MNNNRWGTQVGDLGSLQARYLFWNSGIMGKSKTFHFHLQVLQQSCLHLWMWFHFNLLRPYTFYDIVIFILLMIASS
jgi:hypothetical protein